MQGFFKQIIKLWIICLKLNLMTNDNFLIDLNINRWFLTYVFKIIQVKICLSKQRYKQIYFIF